MNRKRQRHFGNFVTIIYRRERNSIFISKQVVSDKNTDSFMRRKKCGKGTKNHANTRFRVDESSILDNNKRGVKNGRIKERNRRIKERKKCRYDGNYYVDDEVQEIADYVGDSYYLAKMAVKESKDVICFAGVKFMGESAKILNPERTVVMPDENADCPMAHMVEIGKIQEMRRK